MRFPCAYAYANVYACVPCPALPCNSGTITVDEMREGLKAKDTKIPEAELEIIMANADVNGDGKVDYEVGAWRGGKACGTNVCTTVVACLLLRHDDDVVWRRQHQGDYLMT